MVTEENIQPPVNTDIKAWLQTRREELRGKKRTQFHRSIVDQASGVGKIRPLETSGGNN